MDLGTTDDTIFFEYFTLMLVYNGRLNISKLEEFPDTYMNGWTRPLEDEDLIDLIIVTSSYK